MGGTGGIPSPRSVLLMDWTWLCLGLTALPAALGVHNLRRLPSLRGERAEGLVSVLIPARDEAANIEACVTAALASRGVAVEVVVMDDGSTDGTAGIVQHLAAADPRVRLVAAPPLPPDWTGKVHACAR